MNNLRRCLKKSKGRIDCRKTDGMGFNNREIMGLIDGLYSYETETVLPSDKLFMVESGLQDQRKGEGYRPPRGRFLQDGLQ